MVEYLRSRRFYGVRREVSFYELVRAVAALSIKEGVKSRLRRAFDEDLPKRSKRDIDGALESIRKRTDPDEAVELFRQKKDPDEAAEMFRRKKTGQGRSISYGPCYFQ